MKGLRYIKLRSFCHDPAELIQGLHHNPLKASLAVQPSHSFTVKVLNSFKHPADIKSRKPFVTFYIPVSVLKKSLNPACFAIKHLKAGWHGQMNSSFIVLHNLPCRPFYLGKTPVPPPQRPSAKWSQTLHSGQISLNVCPKKTIKMLLRKTMCHA